MAKSKSTIQSQEEVGLAAVERESRIARERNAEPVKQLRPMSEVKKGLNPDEELFMSLPAFEDTNSENPTAEQKQKHVEEVLVV